MRVDSKRIILLTNFDGKHIHFELTLGLMLMMQESKCEMPARRRCRCLFIHEPSTIGHHEQCIFSDRHGQDIFALKLTFRQWLILHNRANFGLTIDQKHHNFSIENWLSENDELWRTKASSTRNRSFWDV